MTLKGQRAVSGGLASKVQIRFHIEESIRELKI